MVLNKRFQALSMELSTENNQYYISFFFFLDLWLTVGPVSYSRGPDSLTNPAPVYSFEVRNEGESATSP